MEDWNEAQSLADLGELTVRWLLGQIPTHFAQGASPDAETAKIQAQVLVPVLRAFRAELGEARANQIASKALREWSQQLCHDIGEQRPGSPRQKRETIAAALIKRVGSDVDCETLKEEPDAWEFNITGCRYADFFRQLREPELGALLTCEMDVDIEAVGSPEVTMTRTQTIMKGAQYCDFRYRLKIRGGARRHSE